MIPSAQMLRCSLILLGLDIVSAQSSQSSLSRALDNLPGEASDEVETKPVTDAAGMMVVPGKVWVTVTVSGGKLVAIVPLETCGDDGTTVEDVSGGEASARETDGASDPVGEMDGGGTESAAVSSN